MLSKESNCERRVLLIAGIDAVGIARLPKLFAKAGFQVTLLGSTGLAAASSRFVSKLIPCGKSPDAAAAAAREHLARNRADYELIIVADEATFWAAVDQQPHDWIQGWFPIPVNPESLEREGSKIRFLLDARAAGIETPRFEICSSEPELRMAVDKIGCPVYLKANRGQSGSGIFFAKTFEELERHIGEMSFSEPVVAQQEIVGDTVSISVLYDHGKPLCWFGYIMRDMWPTRFASASSVEFYWSPAVDTMVEGIGKLTEFNGLAGIDCMLEAGTGRLPLLEFNPRPTPVYHLGPHVGVDFAKAIRGIGSAMPAQRPDGTVKKTIRMFPQSLYHSFEQHDPSKFLDALADAPWDDPRLVAAQLRRVATHYASPEAKACFKRMFRRER